MNSPSLTAFVRVGRRFQRAVNLERDLGRREALKGYIVTPAVQRAVSQIVGGLRTGSAERAWSLVGPYGSGKSAFAVFLADLLAPGRERATSDARKLLKQVSPALTCRAKLEPVVVTGERAPLDLLLLRALHSTIEDKCAGRKGRKPAVLGTLAKYLNGSSPSRLACATSTVVGCFEEAGHFLQDKFDGTGLLVVVDEAGKALEYAAQQPARGDVFLLQALAEAASGSNGSPFVLLTVLHQSFEQYANRLSAAQRNEWAKVQGRFGPLLFRDGIDQVLKMTAEAVEPVKARPKLDGWARQVSTTSKWIAQGTGWDQAVVADSLNRCWPLHPVTASLLGPLFRGRMAQNERSLFAFLCAGEPLSFGEFLKTHDRHALFRVDQLYDYTVATLGSRLFSQDGRSWSEVETALRRLPADADGTDTSTIKTIGLLNILGDQVGLRASEQMLRMCLAPDATVAASVERLGQSSSLIYRHFRDAYQVWEGSDLDLQQLVNSAEDQLSPDLSVASVLQRTSVLQPIVARRHLFETGTLRYFGVRYVEASELLAQQPQPSDDAADGTIFLTLPRSDDEAHSLRQLLRTPEGFGSPDEAKPYLVCVPSIATHLVEIVRELSALESIETRTSSLQSDPVARKELSARIDEAERLLETEVRRSFDPAGCDWYTAGEAVPVDSWRDLSGTVSELCDLGYPFAPPIRNELLNRRKLSSSAAKARRNLIEAMILHGDKERLGFEGYPPEISMYLSLLQTHRMHTQSGGRWVFAKPVREMLPVWKATAAFFDHSEVARQPLSELYATLQRPPFGIREGPLPVIVVAALLERDSEVALYEHGSFVPALTPSVAERLLRSPEALEVRQCRIAGLRREVFQELATSLLMAKRDNPSVLDVVRGLVRFALGLPAYARRAKSLSETALQVRETLITAREPAQLLFQDLPRACGLEPFKKRARKSPEVSARFVERLRHCLHELQEAYPHLLERIEHDLSTMLALPASADELQSELASRAAVLANLAVEPKLKTFVVRAADASLEREDWLVSLATQLASKPPAEWVEGDEERFQVQLARVARRFRSMESVALDAGPGADKNVLRLSVTRGGVTEREQVVTVRAAEAAAIETLRDQVLASINNATASCSPEATLAALALAADHLLGQTEPTTVGAEQEP